MRRDKNYRIGRHRKNNGELSPYWYLYWTENSRSLRRSTGTRNREKAQTVLANFILEKDTPVKKTREQMTLEMVFDDYLDEHVPHIRDQKRAHIAAKDILAYYGNVTVAALNRREIKNYIQYGRTTQKRKDSTINRYLTHLRAALNHAVKEERIESVPLVETLKEPPPRDRYLTPEEAAKLYRAFTYDHKQDHLRLFMDIALRTGARPGAIRDLQWKQVDFHSRIIRFHPEGLPENAKRRATVPMSDDLFVILVARQKKPDDHILPFQGTMSKAFKRACVRAGIPPITPHGMRHTVASWLAQEGVDAWRISLLLGHSFAGMTGRYMHHAKDYLRDEVAILDRKLAQVARIESKTAVFKGGKRDAV